MAKHENFNIDNQARKRHVRQDRIEGEFYLKAKDFRLPILNISAFGVALLTDRQLPEEIFDATIEVSGLDVGEVNLRKVRGQDGTVGFAVVGRPIDIDVVLGLQEVEQAIKAHQDLIEEAGTFDPHFRAIVLEYKNWFTELESRVNALEKSTFEHDRYAVELFEDVASTRVAQYLTNKLKTAYDEIQTYLATLNDNDAQKCFEYFRKLMTPVLHQSAYAHRAFSKPKGYAGDFEMMNHAYLGEIRGETLFAKCLQKYYVEAEASQAVRNRARYMQEKIEKTIASKKATKILAVASGPAMEIQRVLSEKPHLFEDVTVEFHLMDQDLDALKFSQRKVESILRTHKLTGVRVVYHNLAVKNVIVGGFPETNFDLIYSAGLFDYLTDPVAEMTAKRLLASVNDSGSLIIGNFSLENPSRFGMELVMDWHLLHRAPATLEALFKNVASQVAIEREPLGINLFAVLKK